MLTLGVDPNYFALDWERTAEVLAVLVVASLLTERALSLLFENRLFINFEKSRQLHLKEPIALVVATIVCIVTGFDALSIIVLQPETTYFGYLFTGAIIAGGSKGSVKLFRDVLNIKSSAQHAADQEKIEEVERTKKVTAEVKAEAKKTEDKAAATSTSKPAPSKPRGRK